MINLFVVEDHAVMRRTLIFMLEQEDDFVVCGEAASAEEALEQIDGLELDLMLIDVSMPGMDGLTLLQKVQALRPGLPCIILSGHAESVYGSQARDAGAMAYIDKRQARQIVPVIRQALSNNHDN